MRLCLGSNIIIVFIVALICLFSFIIGSFSLFIDGPIYGRIIYAVIAFSGLSYSIGHIIEDIL